MYIDTPYTPHWREPRALGMPYAMWTLPTIALSFWSGALFGICWTKTNQLPSVNKVVHESDSLLSWLSNWLTGLAASYLTYLRALYGLKCVKFKWETLQEMRRGYNFWINMHNFVVRIAGTTFIGKGDQDMCYQASVPIAR